MRFLDDGIGEVTSLFVVRDARRQRLATLLLDQLEAIARGRGLRLLSVELRSLFTNDELQGPVSA